MTCGFVDVILGWLFPRESSLGSSGTVYRGSLVKTSTTSPAGPSWRKDTSPTVTGRREPRYGWAVVVVLVWRPTSFNPNNRPHRSFWWVYSLVPTESSCHRFPRRVLQSRTQSTKPFSNPSYQNDPSTVFDPVKIFARRIIKHRSTNTLLVSSRPRHELFVGSINGPLPR